MKVVLKKEYKKLGKKGDIVEVKDGYGRNYLITEGIALPATKNNIEIVNKKPLEKKKTKILSKKAKSKK